jgi:nucleoside 2-deoxyribosyltransferase
MERNKPLHGMISMNYGNNKQQTSRLHHHYPSLVGQKMVMKSHESPMFISFGSSKNRRSDLGPFRPGTSPWPLKIQACG